MEEHNIVKIESPVLAVYWLFAVCYAFIKWGFWWGLLNVIIPFAPLVDLVKKL